jgi:hypothetical protein
MREQRFLDILGTSAGSNHYIFTFGGAVRRSPLFEEGNRCSPEECGGAEKPQQLG